MKKVDKIDITEVEKNKQDTIKEHTTNNQTTTNEPITNNQTTTNNLAIAQAHNSQKNSSFQEDNQNDSKNDSTTKNGVRDDGKRKTASNEQYIKADSDQSLKGNNSSSETTIQQFGTDEESKPDLSNSIFKAQNINQSLTVSYPTFQEVYEYKERSSFQIVKEAVPYISYQTNMGIFNDYARTIQNTTNEILFKSTLETFPYGAFRVFKKLNTAMFAKNDIQLTDHAAFKSDMIYVAGMTSTVNDMVDYLGGSLALLCMILRDNRVLQHIDSANIDAFAISDSYNLIHSPIMLPVQPNPALRVYSPDIKWISDEILEHIKAQTATYKYGRLSVENDSFYANIKATSLYALNIDQYSASIINLNSKYLLRDGLPLSLRADHLRAHAFAESKIIMSTGNNASISTDLLPTENFDPNHAMITLVFCMCLHPRTISYIHDINIRYMYDTGYIRPTSQDNMFYQGQSMVATAVVFNAYLADRTNSVRADDIIPLLSMEYSPLANIRSLLSIPSPGDVPQAIVVLLELILFSWLCPATFNSVLGIIQHILLDDIFMLLAPNEVTKFEAKYGYKYKIENGIKRFITDTTEIWKQEQYYTSEYYPSLFADQVFHECKTITMLMNYFKSPGKLVPNTRAIKAKFPRLSKNPSTFISFSVNTRKNQPNRGEFSDKFIRLNNDIKKVIANVTDNRSSLKSDSVNLNRWMNHILLRLTIVEDSFSLLFAPMADTMSNFMLNFQENFNGDHSTFKHKQYSVCSNDRPTAQLIRFDGPSTSQEFNNFSIVNTGLVWALLGGIDTPLMVNEGRSTTSKVPLTESILVPGPDSSYTQSLGVLKKLEDSLLSHALVTMLGSKIAFDNIPDLTTFKAKLPVRSLNSSAIEHLRNQLIKIIGTENDDYGKKVIDYIGKLTMNLAYIDPTIRRTSLMEEILPFDAGIDHIAFKDPLTLMKPLELRRLDIGLRFIERSGIIRLDRGIRLASRTTSVFNPDEMLSIPDDYKVIEYDPMRSYEVFTDILIGSNKFFGLVSATSVTPSYKPQEWPKMHVTIKNRSMIPTEHIELLIIGIMEAEWIVDVLDVAFTYSITSNLTTMYDKNILSETLSAPIGKVMHYTFIDNCQDGILINYGALSQVFTSRKYLYPLGLISLTENNSARLLVSGARQERLNNSSYSSPIEYDTGNIDANFDLTYTDHDRKIDLRNISMTNQVHVFSKNSQLELETQYKLITPPAFFKIMDKNNGIISG